MSASNGVFVRRHVWDESAGAEKEAQEEDQEGRSSGGGDMANDLSGGDLDSDFDVESEEAEEVEEEGGNDGGEFDINGHDTIGQCTSGHAAIRHGTDDHGSGDISGHPNGVIGGSNRKRGRSPSELDVAEGGDFMSARVPGFARNEKDSGAGDNERAEEEEEEEEEDEEEEEEVEDDGFSEDLEDDNGNGLADRNYAEGRGASDTCSGGGADVAAEGGADVERAGEAAAHPTKADVAAAESTTEGLLPDEVILEIIARVSYARARNCCALVSRRWRMSERLTRTSLSVRRSLADLLELPRCFPNVRRLDLSLCPPCGQPLLLAGTALEVATTLRAAFPRVTSLRVHVRDRNDVQCVAATWPGLEHVALIRWHEFSAAEAAAAAAEQGANNNNTGNPNLNANPLGTLELTPLLVMCSRVQSIDLSEFTGAAAAAEPPYKPPRAPLPRPSAPISALRHLNLLKSSPGAFKASDVRSILTAAGRTLLSFRCLVEFDPRLSDSLSDETLIEIAERCPVLTALQLVDSSLWAAPSGLSLALGDHDDALPPDMDARVTPGGIRSFLARLPGLEELDLRPAQYLRGADVSLFGGAAGAFAGGTTAGGGGGGGRGGVTATVSLGQLSPNLKRLRLGQLVFAHNDSLAPVPASGEGTSGEGSSAQGSFGKTPSSSSASSSSAAQGTTTPPSTSTILPGGLEALDFWQAPSLPLRCLLPLALSCPRLKELSIWGCPDLTPPSLEAVARVCRHSLVRVTVVKCCNLPTAAVLRALSPVRSTLQHLHCSCDWFCPNSSVAPVSPVQSGADGNGDGADGTGAGATGGAAGEGAGEGMVKQAGGGRRMEGRAGADGTEELLYGSEAAQDLSTAPDSSEWPALQSLTLLAPLGTLLFQLPSAGLLHCPLLSHVHIRVYGDCRLAAGGPGAAGFGLSCLAGYPALRFLRLDLTQVVGHSLSCPPGLAFDVMAWERFYLHGIQLLPGLESLHYWPPSDCDLNRRSMSMPSAGILGSCQSLRQLAVHCTTANEHLLNVVVRGARGMRDLHVLGDCYPAPPDDTYAGMLRPISFQRLIKVLDDRGYPD
ncbi:unnamed protein product [Closterium sp. Naga37s-1]|nr:unnamed protein product [Closterium sp. Naga37s-1]